MTHTDTVPMLTAFDRPLWANLNVAIEEAQAIADANGAPCAVWGRDGWYTAVDVPPDDITPDPYAIGWEVWAVVDPMGAEMPDGNVGWP